MSFLGVAVVGIVFRVDDDYDDDKSFAVRDTKIDGYKGLDHAARFMLNVLAARLCVVCCALCLRPPASHAVADASHSARGFPPGRMT
jgi:hypothetical protein